MNYTLMKFNAGKPFESVGTSAMIWTDFLAWWTYRWPGENGKPGRCLPCTHGLHNLCGLTGLSAVQVTTLLEKRTPAALMPPGVTKCYRFGQGTKTPAPNGRPHEQAGTLISPR